MWRTSAGLRHLDTLPDKVRHAALESIVGPIADDSNRAGEPLVDEFESLWSAPRGDYRIIHETFDDEQNVLFRRVQHCRDAYQPRSPHPTTRLCAQRRETMQNGEK